MACNFRSTLPASTIYCTVKKVKDRSFSLPQTKDTLTKALQEDPTVFDYDGVYDEMQKQKELTNAKSKAKKETKVNFLVKIRACKSKTLLK